MAFIPVPNVAQINVRGSVDNQQIENTLYFQSDTTVTQAGLAQLGSDMYGYVVANWLPQLPSDYSLRELYCIDLTTQTSETYTFPAEPEDVGLLSGSVLPNNCSFTITFVTSQRGRSFRGRNFWPLLRESDVRNNTLLETRAGFIRTIYTLMVGPDEVSSGWTWGVVSRYANSAARPSGIFTPCQSAKYTDLTVDSQRRRLPSRGR